jgi:hypothetical protein
MKKLNQERNRPYKQSQESLQTSSWCMNSSPKSNLDGQSFNSEVLRLLLATTFPNAQPSSWWLSGASTSSGPGQSFQISLTVVYTRKRGKQGRKASNPPLAQLRPSKPLVFKKTSKTKGKNLMLQDGSSSVTPDTLEGLRTSPRIRSLLDGHRKPV